MLPRLALPHVIRRRYLAHYSYLAELVSNFASSEMSQFDHHGLSNRRGTVIFAKLETLLGVQNLPPLVTTVLTTVFVNMNESIRSS